MKDVMIWSKTSKSPIKDKKFSIRGKSYDLGLKTKIKN